MYASRFRVCGRGAQAMVPAISKQVFPTHFISRQQSIVSNVGLGEKLRQRFMVLEAATIRTPSPIHYMCGRCDDDDDDGICTSNTCIMNKVANDDRELMFQDYSDYGVRDTWVCRRCKNKVRKRMCNGLLRWGGRGRPKGSRLKIYACHTWNWICVCYNVGYVIIEYSNGCGC